MTTCLKCDDFGMVEGVGKWYDAEVQFRPCPACGDECRDWGRPVTSHYPRSEHHGAEANYWYHVAYLEAARIHRREGLAVGVVAGLCLGILLGLSIYSVLLLGW